MSFKHSGKKPEPTVLLLDDLYITLVKNHIQPNEKCVNDIYFFIMVYYSSISIVAILLALPIRLVLISYSDISKLSRAEFQAGSSAL